MPPGKLYFLKAPLLVHYASSYKYFLTHDKRDAQCFQGTACPDCQDTQTQKAPRVQIHMVQLCKHILSTSYHFPAGGLQHQEANYFPAEE